MQVDVKQLLELIFEGDVSASPACQACEDMLDQYVDAELDGKDVGTLFPNIKAHLNQCALCQESHQELKILLQMEHQGTLVEPPVEANFDFSFIPAPQPTSIWQVIERKGRQITELFTTIDIVVKEGQAFFDQLPSLLVPQWKPVVMSSRTRKSVLQVPEGSEMRDEKQQVPVLSFPSPEHDLSLTLNVIPPQPEESNPTLTIEVTQLSSKQPVRARVALRDVEYRLLQSYMTDKDRYATFSDVEPDIYVLDVKSGGRVWQLPIKVTWQT